MNIERQTAEQIYIRIRKRACQIVFRFPSPDFYKDFPEAVRLSRECFETEPVICRLRAFAEKHLNDDFGHGLKHAVKVSLDAGALMMIECSRAEYSEEWAMRRMLVTQCAGLLHDIKRKEAEHAVKGAEYAREVLKNYPLSRFEAEDIAQAIRNHEAFKDSVAINTPEGLLLSDCLYDADKFRWGPDNFTDTVWDMVSFFKTPLPKFMELYPKGMKKIAEIRNTFRTYTGKKYGPQFIDTGLAIGEELLSVIRSEFACFL